MQLLANVAGHGFKLSLWDLLGWACLSVLAPIEVFGLKPN
jgi:hypothetical protein